MMQDNVVFIVLCDFIVKNLGVKIKKYLKKINEYKKSTVSFKQNVMKDYMLFIRSI